MNAKEVLSLGVDGGVNTEFFGFQGKACLKQAAEIAEELERLGVVAQVTDIVMKDTSEPAPVAQQAQVKIAEG